MASSANFPPLWPFLLLSVAAALLIDLGAFHGFHHADSLIPVQVSLQAWTPYYWEQNRYGMLVPLLAIPFSHPLINLLVQNGLTIAAGVAAIYLAARYLYPDRSWPFVGSVSVIAFLAAAPPVLKWMYLSTFNVFATSLFLGLSSLLVARATGRTSIGLRGVAATGLVFLAAWTNSAIGLVLGPVVVAVAFVRLCTGPDEPSWRLGRITLNAHIARMGVELALLVAATGFAMVTQRLVPYRTTWLVVPPVEEWPRLAIAVGDGLWREGDTQVWAVVLFVFAGLAFVALRVRGTRTEAIRGVLTGVAVVAAVAFYALLMGILFQGRWRYAVPGLILAHVAVIGAALNSWGPALSGFKQPWALRVLAGGVLATAMGMYGLPSISGVRQTLDDQFGRDADAVIAARATHVSGGYWRVWPAVFEANLKRADRGEGSLYGVSERSGPTTSLWLSVPKPSVRVAVLNDDPEALKHLRAFPYPLEHSETVGSVRVYRPAGEAAP